MCSPLADPDSPPQPTPRDPLVTELIDLAVELILIATEYEVYKILPHKTKIRLQQIAQGLLTLSNRME